MVTVVSVMDTAIPRDAGCAQRGGESTPSRNRIAFFQQFRSKLLRLFIHPKTRPTHFAIMATLVGSSLVLLAPVFSDAPTKPGETAVTSAITAELVPQLGHSQSVTSVAFSHHGGRIASGSEDSTVRLWDAESGEVLGILAGHEGSVSSVAFSPDGRGIASGSWDGTVRLWDAESGEVLGTLAGHEGLVSSVAFSPDGRHIASGSGDSTVRLWDAESGEVLGTLVGHEGLVSSVAFSPDGRRIASGSGDGTVRLWDAESGEVLGTLVGHEGLVSSVAFSPDGRRIASGGRGRTVRLWDAESGEELGTPLRHGGRVNSVSFSPDGRRIASGSWDGTLRLWDAESGEVLGTLAGHEGSVSSVAFSPDGRRIASGSRDGTVHLWDAESGEVLGTMAGYGGSVTSVAFSPDGRRIASGSGDGTLRLWDAESGEVLDTPLRHGGRVNSVSFSPDGRRIASGSWDGTLRLWDAESGEVLGTLAGHEGSVTSVAFSPDGRRIASGSGDGTVHLWDGESGEVLGTLAGHERWVTSVAFSPDGRRIASGGWGRTVRLWDAESGEELGTLAGHEGSVSSVAFSPDGRRIASGSWDGTVHLWDGESGEVLGILAGHEGWVSSVAFSPDGRRIASGDADSAVRLWDAESGEVLGILAGHEGLVSSVAFSSDGRRIASGGGDSAVRLWDAQIQEQRLVLQSLPGGWITHKPHRLTYIASPDAERYVRIRFDGARCRIFRWIHGKYCPVYPLAWYQDGLRHNLGQHSSALWKELNRPFPELRPKKLRMVWHRTSNEVRVGLGFVSVSIIIALIAIRTRVRGRDDPLTIPKAFFGKTHYRVGRKLRTRAAAILLESDGGERHCAVMNSGSNGGVSSVVAKYLELQKGAPPRLFVIHPDSEDRNRRQLNEEARQIQAEHRIDVVPLELADLHRALHDNDCDRTLREAEYTYMTREDPYHDSNPITDPNFFFGRHQQLMTIPFLLSQGRHVGLFGLRKTGKTSLANQLQVQLRHIPTVMIGCQGLDETSASGFLSRITSHLGTELSVRLGPSKTHDLLDENADFDAQLRTLIQSWQQSGRQEPFVVMLDEIEVLLPIKDDHAPYDTVVKGRRVLGTLRALAQELQGIVLLVIGYRPDINRINRLPADAGENPLFMGFEEVYSGFLSEDDSKTMIRDIGAWRGIEWEDASLQRMYEYCGGHPFITRLFASDACRQGRRTRVKLDHVEGTANTIKGSMRRHQIGAAYAQIVDSLLDQERELLRHTNASPESFAESRVPRELEQALTNLENFGLVTTSNGTIEFSAELFEYWVKTRLEG